MSASHNWEWVQNREEGQFLERKSCYDRSSGESRPRPVKEVVQDVAAALVAMANADGGTVVVGIEDDGTVTGIPARYEFHQVQKQLNDYIRPALKFRLRNTLVYRPEILRWLRQFEGKGLSRNQTRLLAYAHEHGDQFTSRAYQKLVGVDPYTASRDIQDLIRKGIVRRTQPHGRVYEIITKPEMVVLEKPPEFLAIEPILQQKGFVKNEDIRKALGISRIRAFRLLQSLTEHGFLKKEGKGRGARYVPSKKMFQR
jgi:predicted HTH transcriptional regulator